MLIMQVPMNFTKWILRVVLYSRNPRYISYKRCSKCVCILGSYCNKAIALFQMKVLKNVTKLRYITNDQGIRLYQRLLYNMQIT